MGDALLSQQSRKRDEVARSHVEKVAENLNEMRKAGISCDCRLEVRTICGNLSPKVHYAVVSAASEYCRSNLRCHNGKLPVVVDLEYWLDKTETVKAALEQCIEFMYIGKAHIRKDTAEYITRLSHKLQLKPLEDMGLEVMQHNLTTSSNCSILVSAARYCKREEYEAEAIKKWISLNLQRVPAPNECITKNMWGSAVNLLKNSSCFKLKCKMLDVLKVIEIEKIDCNFLLDVIMKNEKVNRDSAAAGFTIRTISQKINKDPSNLTTENYCTVKDLLVKHSCEDTSSLKGILDNFVINNFDTLAQQGGFLEIKQDEVTSILNSSELLCVEKIKFDFMTKWVSHEPEERADTFPELFKLIKLRNLSEEELISIRMNPLVEKNASLLSSVFDALVKKRETPAIPLQRDTTQWYTPEILVPDKNSLI